MITNSFKQAGIIVAVLLISGLESCNVSEEILPDINTILSKTFQIRIYENSGTTSDQVVDIFSSSEYNDFKKIVDGYELTKITFQLKNDNVPEDMYFSGEIVCKNDEGNHPVTAGIISRVKISAAAAGKTENDVTENMTDINKVLGWLEDPGKFNLSATYTLTNENNSAYQISPSVTGSNFELIIRFYIKVKTSL